MGNSLMSKTHHTQNMKKFFTLFIILTMVATTSLSTNTTKVVGGDISMLTKYIEAGCTYYDFEGHLLDGTSGVLAFMKSQGLNSMRVRLFVDPSKADDEDKGEGVCQDLSYVKILGKQIKNAGLAFLLDLHYSDTWTDPEQHATPDSWNSTDPTTLGNYLYNYTVDVLTQLKNAGAEPDDIQIGNEVTNGLLWPTGYCYANGQGVSTGGIQGKMENFALYLKCGAEACREVCPNARIIIHTELSNNGWGAKTLYTTLESYNVDYDIIGLSYYPYFHGKMNVLEDVLSSLERSQPTKKIQIVETGYYSMWQPSIGEGYDYSNTYPISDAGQKAFTEALIEKLNSHPNVNGLYWWWMEGNEKGNTSGKNVTTNWYGASLWNNNTGMPNQALASLQKFLDEPSATDELRLYTFFINQTGWGKVYAYSNYWTQEEGETVYSDSWPGTLCTSAGSATVDGNTYGKYRFDCPTSVTTIRNIPMHIRYNNGNGDEAWEMGFLNGATYRRYQNGGQNITECYMLTLLDGAGKTDHTSDFWCRKAVQVINMGYDRIFTANQPSTICLPFALTSEEVSRAGKFYKLTAYDGNNLTFSPVNATEAYTPYLFMAAESGQPFLSLGVKDIGETSLIDVSGDEAVMKGVMERQSIGSTDDHVVFGYLESSGEFVRVKSGNINPFRAYIIIPRTAVNTNALQLSFLDTEIIKEESANKCAEGQVFTLGGMTATPNYKGIIIRNGKKQVVR